MRDLRGKVAVITGAASGIGLAVARQLAAEGMKLALADVDEPALDQAARQLGEGGAAVRAVPTDVSRESDVAALAEQTLAAFGRVHLVFNNAGVLSLKASWEYTVADWQWLLGVNLWGVIHGIRTFVPVMLAQGDDCHIVNTASSAGLTTAAFMAAYNVGKHGVVVLSEDLARELSAIGARIHVSVLCPGLVRTQLFDAARNRPVALRNAAETIHPEAQSLEQSFRERIPNRAISPDAVADLVLAAVRDERFYIFTHPDTLVAVRQRFAGIQEDRLP
jgi:NAD(P)-dependent dehydrogenase (short-subunit alcohol dehydrogenase family)